jgi:hypothetical protein
MLHRVCSTCETHNPPNEFFCAGCGAGISSIEPTEQPPAVAATSATHATAVAAHPHHDSGNVRCPNPDCGLEQVSGDRCARCDTALPAAVSWLLVWPWNQETVLAGALPIGRESSPEWLLRQYQREGFDNLSRSHALLETSGTRAQVTDLHSSNGTFLNGKPLAPQSTTSLQSGDELRFASRLTLTVRQRSQE